MLTTAAIVTIMIGIVINLILQAWVQPRAFRADNKLQADLIIGRFDAQIECVKAISENASRTLDDAAKFFQTSDERFAIIEHRLEINEAQWRTAQEQWKTTHALVENFTRLDKRLSVVESVCASRHEGSMRTVIEERNRDAEDDGFMKGR